jgi:hypothetical protein
MGRRRIIENEGRERERTPQKSFQHESKKKLQKTDTERHLERTGQEIMSYIKKTKMREKLRRRSCGKSETYGDLTVKRPK